MATHQKLYIVIQSNLKAGMKIAQGVHAAIAFTMRYPDLSKQWHDHSNNIVCLQSDDIRGLADELEGKGLRLSRFHEPDLEGELTAFAAEPAAWKSLSKHRLAA